MIDLIGIWIGYLSVGDVFAALTHVHLRLDEIGEHEESIETHSRAQGVAVELWYDSIVPEILPNSVINRKEVLDHRVHEHQMTDVA